VSENQTRDRKGQFGHALHPEAGGVSLGAASAGTESSRDEMVAARKELNARIGAMDVNEAAAALKRKFPKAHSIAAYRTSHQVFDPEEMTIQITDKENNRIWEGSRHKLPQLGSLSLIPDQYQAVESPLRTSAIPHHNHTWRHYSLYRMGAVTAEDLMEDE
jgi:hypothetical protein